MFAPPRYSWRSTMDFQSLPFMPCQTCVPVPQIPTYAGLTLRSVSRVSETPGNHTDLDLIFPTSWDFDVLETYITLAVESQCFHHLEPKIGLCG